MMQQIHGPVLVCKYALTHFLANAHLGFVPAEGNYGYPKKGGKELCRICAACCSGGA